MNFSPLQFARDFSKLKSDLSDQPVPDLRLLELLEFWQYLEPMVIEASYRSYIDEFSSILLGLVTEQTLSDSKVEELSTLKNVLRSLNGLDFDKTTKDSLGLKLRLVSYKLAALLFYVGDIDRALPICGEIARLDNVIPYDKGILDGLDAYDSLRVLAQAYGSISPPLADILQDIYDRWEAERASVNQDRALCLFVEKRFGGLPDRGRLKVLRGTVETKDKAGDNTEEADTIILDNQVKSPDDPFVGAAYESLKAVRVALRNTGHDSRFDKPYQAHFNIELSQQIFTGDSIGLAMALVSYTQLLRTEITRQQKFTSNEVAVTGGIDADGKFLPINRDTLDLKLERAFFSPVKCIVMPWECCSDAQKYLNNLLEKYPRRRLQLIGHKSLADAIEDLNVVRSEKMGIGSYFARRMRKHRRAISCGIIVLVLAFVSLELYKHHQATLEKQHIMNLLKMAYAKKTPIIELDPEWIKLIPRFYDELDKGKHDSLLYWFFKASNVPTYDYEEYSPADRAHLDVHYRDMTKFNGRIRQNWSSNVYPSDIFVSSYRIEYSIDGDEYKISEPSREDLARNYKSDNSGLSRCCFLNQLKDLSDNKHQIVIRSVLRHYFDASLFRLKRWQFSKMRPERFRDTSKVSMVDSEGDSLVETEISTYGRFKIFDRGTMENAKPDIVDTTIDTLTIITHDYRPKIIFHPSLKVQYDEGFKLIKMTMIKYKDCEAMVLSGHFLRDLRPIAANMKIFEKNTRKVLFTGNLIFFDRYLRVTLSEKHYYAYVWKDSCDKIYCTISPDYEDNNFPYDRFLKYGNIEARYELIPSVEIAKSGNRMYEYWGDTLTADIIFQCIDSSTVERATHLEDANYYTLEEEIERRERLSK